MNLQDAAEYWQSRLKAGKPIYRVRVRRILELAGAERRGYAIVKQIREIFEAFGLVTIPDFEVAWIDSLVRVRLAGETPAQAEDDALDQTTDQACPANGGTVDPALTEETSSTEETAAVAEPLNAPPVENTVSATVTQDDSSDPVIRILSLAAANRGVVSVSANDPVAAATTRMFFENYSQLAVMHGTRDVKGMISWESIAKRSLQTPRPVTVQDCMEEAQILNATSSILEALPVVENHGYVLVRHHGKITGIVTATDFATELAQMSQAFMQLGTIEKLIRKKLHPCLTMNDLANLEENSRARSEMDVSKLTFGENVRLLEDPAVWRRLNLALDKAQFTQRLLEVRNIRNDVMHFNPDPLSRPQKKSLDQMESFLEASFCVTSFGAATELPSAEATAISGKRPAVSLPAILHIFS